jgi:hypothetical protein
MKKFDYSKTDIYKILLPEVENVAFNDLELTEEVVNENDIKSITQRICEEREEDSTDFYVYLSEVESMGDEEDWSDVNNGIANMIEKHLKEQGKWVEEE